ncbi:hypothetical protein ABBQ38_007145 [Trebouxia sp. C0009 RCD-2024]
MGAPSSGCSVVQQRHTLSAGAEVEAPHAFQSCIELEMVEDPIHAATLSATADLRFQMKTVSSQGSSNSQPFFFSGVDFANLSACDAAAQQASWEPAPSAVENSLIKQQSSEQPQDVSKTADKPAFNNEVFDNLQGVASSNYGATQLSTEHPPAHQSDNSFTVCTSRFIHFGVDPATLQACSATAQQASNKAASSAAKITNSQHPSPWPCKTQNCAEQSQASTYAVSSSPPAAQEATLSRAGPSPALPCRRRRRHRASTLSAAALPELEAGLQSAERQRH